MAKYSDTDILDFLEGTQKVDSGEEWEDEGGYTMPVRFENPDAEGEFIWALCHEEDDWDVEAPTLRQCVELAIEKVEGG